MKIEMQQTETESLSRLLMVVIIAVVIMVVAIEYKDKIGDVHYGTETKKELDVKMND